MAIMGNRIRDAYKGNLTPTPKQTNKQNIIIHNPMAYNITIHNIL